MFTTDGGNDGGRGQHLAILAKYTLQLKSASDQLEAIQWIDLSRADALFNSCVVDKADKKNACLSNAIFVCSFEKLPTKDALRHVT